MANFLYPLPFSVLHRGDPFRISGKALRILKLESSCSPWWRFRDRLRCVDTIPERDKRTDGRLDDG